MTRPIPCVVLCCCLLAPAAAVAGSTSRYALVVGSNTGHVAGGVDLEPLRHAEREAVRLREQLVSFANFTPERVEMVAGGGRAQVLAAVDRLVAQRRRDATQLGDVPTLFALFFTGHGLSGRLLTRDEPIDGKDLSEMVRRMDASLTVGFFDACFSGSIDLAALRSKGLASTPGFNPATELPHEVLDSEGTLWFVSSRPNELSYEDDRLGGLFTHFFIESFTAAPGDGVGVTLESMWEYAGKKTGSYAARFGRTQTPERIVRDLKSRGPLYFSFPGKRSATLRFHEDVEGMFLLQYEEAMLVERIVKQRGRPLAVAVYEGDAVLRRLDAAPNAGQASRHLSIARGASVLVQPFGIDPAPRALGFGDLPIHGKGTLPELQLSQEAPRVQLMFQAGSRWLPALENRLGPDHAGALGLVLFRGPLRLGLTGSWGARSHGYPGWSYREQELAVLADVGLGYDFAGVRLDLCAAAGPAFGQLRYGNGTTRSPVGVLARSGLSATLALPRQRPWIGLTAMAGLGARWVEGLAQGATGRALGVSPVLELSVGVPLALE